MIQSIDKVLVDAQNGQEEIIYFDYSVEQKDEFQGKVSYLISAFTLSDKKTPEGKDLFVEIKRIPCEYKLSTWLNLFGHLTIKEFSEKRDEIMIIEIGKNYKSFYGCKSENLKTYTQNEIENETE